MRQHWLLLCNATHFVFKNCIGDLRIRFNQIYRCAQLVLADQRRKQSFARYNARKNKPLKLCIWLSRRVLFYKLILISKLFACCKNRWVGFITSFFSTEMLLAITFSNDEAEAVRQDPVSCNGSLDATEVSTLLWQSLEIHMPYL